MTTLRFWLCTGLLALSLGVQAQDVNERTRKRQEIEKEIEAIDKQLASTQAQHQTGLSRLRLLQQKISSRKQLLTSIETQVAQLGDSVRTAEKKVAQVQAEYETLELAYLQLLYKAYTHRNRQVWIAYVLASDNIRQAYRRWRYFRDFSRYMNQQAEQMKKTSMMLSQEMSTLKKLQAEAESLRAAQQKELATLSEDERSARQLITDMTRQEKTLKAQLQQKREEIEKINKEIEKILAEAEKSRKAAGVKEQEIDRTLAANFEQNKGNLPWPLSRGVVIAQFGQHNHPVFKGIKMPFNNGIGISGSASDEVCAVFQGVVRQIVFLPGYNQCVLVQHGSYYTFYCRLGTVKVKTGDTIATGDVIGSLAAIEGEYSLHFELWKGTEKQNPELWLRKR